MRLGCVTLVTTLLAGGLTSCSTTSDPPIRLAKPGEFSVTHAIQADTRTVRVELTSATNRPVCVPVDFWPTNESAEPQSVLPGTKITWGQQEFPYKLQSGGIRDCFGTCLLKVEAGQTIYSSWSLRAFGLPPEANAGDLSAMFDIPVYTGC